MNVDYQTETEQFGAWEAAWSKHCPEIDRRIVRFMEDSPSFSPESLAILTSEISDWLDTRQINGEAWVEWRRIRLEPDGLRARVEQRIAHLVADGSLRLNIWREGWHY